jgi:hypothetical protein
MYHVGRNGKQSGPFSVEQLRALVARGELAPTDLVWKDGMAGWEPASVIPGLFDPEPSVTLAPQAVPPPPITHTTVLPPAGVKIETYLGAAIATTLCCCQPFGIVAIVYAAQVNAKVAAGDLAGAQEASRLAKTWSWVAFGLGLAAWVFFFLIGMMDEFSKGVNRY